MDIDLVLEVTEEELLEFPEEGPSEGHLELYITGTSIPNYSQDSLKTKQVSTEDTPPEEKVHILDSNHPTNKSRGDTTNKDSSSSWHKAPNTETSVYVPRRRSRHGKPRQERWERWNQRRQAQSYRGAQRIAYGSYGITSTPNLSKLKNNGRTSGPNDQMTPGPGGPGGSDPESSDSCNNMGRPKNRDGDPAYHARQKKKTKRVIKRIGPPTFKGEPGERPEAHLLRTLNWFDAIGIATDGGRLRSFKHTLDSNAREWFADLWTTKRDITWELVTNEFLRYFSTRKGLTHICIMRGKLSHLTQTQWI